jgi:4-amino-4-deoxy-L-arabinose transferase-like glycosyltransferase
VSDRSIKILGGVGAAVAIYFVYFFHLTVVGIGGTDEPRYAAIARDMAVSGDWITPRLFGAGWFEKPALVYWMIGLGFRMGLSQDLAPRLPIAILSVAFLCFYYWVLGREFGTRAALFSVLLLGTSAFWIAFSTS